MSRPTIPIGPDDQPDPMILEIRDMVVRARQQHEHGLIRVYCSVKECSQITDLADFDAADRAIHAPGTPEEHFLHFEGVQFTIGTRVVYADGREA